MSGSRQSKRNSKSKKKLPENVELKFRTKERDERIDQENLKGKIGAIYEKWRHSFINKPKTREGLVDAVNELRASLVKEFPAGPAREFVDRMLEEKMATIHGLNIQSKYDVPVYVDCPHTITVAGSKSDCGWGGLVGAPQHLWLSKKFEIKCPQCGGLLTVKDMIEKGEMDRKTQQDAERN